MEIGDVRPLVNRKVEAAKAGLPSLLNNQAPDRLQAVFRGLTRETIMAYEDLCGGFDQSRLQRMAWATRYLWELEHWCWFVSVSPENARRFHSDRLADGKDLGCRLGNFVDSQPMLASVAPLFHTFIQQVDCEMAEEGLSLGSHYLEVRDVARARSAEEPYKVGNAVLSKLTHATAASILMSPNDDEFKFLSEGLLGVGCLLAGQVLGQAQ